MSEQGTPWISWEESFPQSRRVTLFVHWTGGVRPATRSDIATALGVTSDELEDWLERRKRDGSYVSTQGQTGAAR